MIFKKLSDLDSLSLLLITGLGVSGSVIYFIPSCPSNSCFVYTIVCSILANANPCGCKPILTHPTYKCPSWPLSWHDMVQVSPPQIPQEEFKPQTPIQLVVTVNRQYAQLNGLPDASILHYRGKKIQ